MEKKLLDKLTDERFCRNMYYEDYQKANEENEDYCMQMYLIHEYAYNMLCTITGQKYITPSDDYKAARGVRRYL